jgi:VWFA-related protein
MRRVFQLFAVVALTTCSFAANLTYVRIDQPIVESRLALRPVDQAARLTMLRNQFLKAGCTADRIKEQHVPGQDEPNLICTLPGTEPGSIVIAARSDFQSKGDEAKVDWATLTMLPLLTESLYGAAHRYSLVFIAFSGHKDLEGSAAYLQGLSDDERKSIRAMIDLDQIGRTPATYAFATVEATPGISHVGTRPVANTITHADTPMSRLLPLAAATLKFHEAPEKNAEQLVTDAQNFERASVLALTITSPAYTTLIRPGNTVVKMARTELDPNVYYQTYNLLCVYTLYLDRGIAPPKAQLSTDVGHASAVVPTAPPAAAAQLPAPAAASPTLAPAVATGTAVKPLLPSSTAATASTTSAVEPPPDPDIPTPTFRSTTRLVQVDVVVTDKAGNPITGLKESDFTVFQDGKPQPVRAFEAHVPTASVTSLSVQRAAALPPNTYTNLPTATPDQSWTIVLYDQLNTPTGDQQVARQQLVKVLKTLPAGTPVALFMLGQQRLELLHGFSNDPTEITKAAERIRPQVSEMLTTHAQQLDDVAQIKGTAAAAASPNGSPENANNVGSLTKKDHLSITYKNVEALRTNTRTQFTLDALEAMARAVSGYPGRKNLMWLSGSFPIRVEPDPAIDDPMRFVRDYHQRIARADALLTESRVAVYTIDVRGLLNDLPDAVTLDERESLTQIAYETGGRAFVGTNDFGGAIKKAMADGSTYYTVAYTPPPQKDKSEPYHRIEVKLNHPDTNLSYRRGYYSSPQHTTSEQGIAALLGALQPGMPPATMLYVMASVEPPKAKQKTVKINYIIAPSNVTFTDLPENKKHVLIDCMAVAFDKDGKEVAHASDTLDGAIPQAAYDAVMKQGLPANQEIELKPGTYNLRLGVMDRATQQVGTVDVPLEILDVSPGK